MSSDILQWALRPDGWNRKCSPTRFKPRNRWKVTKHFASASAVISYTGKKCISWKPSLSERHKNGEPRIVHPAKGKLGEKDGGDATVSPERSCCSTLLNVLSRFKF